MASIVIKNLSNEIYHRLKEMAKTNHCSISGQAVLLLDQELAKQANSVLPRP